MSRSPNQLSLFGDPPTQPPPAAAKQERRNSILEAGAGTGKTTAIVIRVVELLLSHPDLDPREIVLITFTEKAAAEIADRIREALIGLETNLNQNDPTFRSPTGEVIWTVPEPIDGTAKETLAIQLERIEHLESQTIHSFCQGVLRRFPIEARLDPQFQIIHGFDLDHFHDEAFREWLTGEMSSAENHEDWVRLYTHFRYLDRIREGLINLLPRRDLILDSSLSLGEVEDYERQMHRWIEEAKSLDSKMIDSISHDPNRAVLDHLRNEQAPRTGSIETWIAYLRPIEEDLQEINLTSRNSAKSLLKQLRGDDSKSGGRKVTVIEILRLQSVALSFRAVASRFFIWMRDEMDRRGLVDFDEILYRTRDLLEDPRVASRIRRAFRYIFVDEFQDTDRVQAEIVRKLASDDKGYLIEGRTVIVGDPKQSIYSFRRADPEMFDSMCRELQSAGASRDYLDRQFRSDEVLLDNFNLLFAELFGEAIHHATDAPAALRDMLTEKSRFVYQPGYQRLEAARGTERDPREARFHFVRALFDDESSLEKGQARAVARWIDQARKNGEPLERFAVLLRKMTRIQDFLEVFEAFDIPYRVPTSRSFLDQPASVDLLGVLRAISFPFDRGAEISAARSPWFALSDDEIVRHLLDLPHEEPCAWASFAEEIGRYREIAKFESVSEMIERLVAEREIEFLYASLVAGDEPLRQLDQMRDLGLRWDIETGGSIREFVDEMTRRRDSGAPGESLPDQDSSGAIRVMTVHAAKGLEFDTVILPDLSPTLGGRGIEAAAIDPINRLVFRRGLHSISARFPLLEGETPEMILTSREVAEEQRLFYVAVTRAKSRVVFAIHKRLKDRVFWRCLEKPLGLSMKTLDTHWPEPGDPSVDVDFPLRSSSIRIAFHNFSDEGDLEREARRFVNPRLAGEATPAFAANTASHRTPEREALDPAEIAIRTASLRKKDEGLLLHRILENWTGDPKSLEETVSRLVAEAAADESTERRVRQRIDHLVSTPIYRRLQAAETVGREVTIHHRSENGRRIESRIDRLIRENGLLSVLDYKTGKRTTERAERDDEQVRRYCRAVENLTGERCNGLLWYIDIDSDEVVEVH